LRFRPTAKYGRHTQWVPYYLVYVSSATTLFSDSELDEILDKSHQNNGRLDVSGILLYKDGNLMQILEGEEATVRALYAKIATDHRHKGLITLLDGYQSERQFRDWSMAFRNLNKDQPVSTPGYSEFLNTPLTAAPFAADPTMCQRLLRTFRESM
jgi:hypothetical protein